MAVWRWIDSGPADGAFHMALDQALLENPSRSKIPTMRVYCWRPACISLGANQSVESIDLDRCRQDGIEAVRRPSGGRAVLHDADVTYSIVFPVGSPLYLRRLSELYHFIHGGLLRGMRKIDVPAVHEKRSLDIRNHYNSSLSTSCFSAAAKFEIVVQGKKMVGSAQRRLASGVLQHGSVLLGRGRHQLTDYLKGVKTEDREIMERTLDGKRISIEEVLNRKVSFDEVVSAIKQGMAEFLSVEFEEGGLTETEACRSRQLSGRLSILSLKKKASRSHDPA